MPSQSFATDSIRRYIYFALTWQGLRLSMILLLYLANLYQTEAQDSPQFCDTFAFCSLPFIDVVPHNIFGLWLVGQISQHNLLVYIITQFENIQK